MVLGPLPPHPHIPNPFCALLAGWGLPGCGQQSKLSRLRSSPNFKCTLHAHPFYRSARPDLCGFVLREAGGKMKMKMPNPNLKTMEWPLSSSSRNGCSQPISLGGGFSFASDKPPVNALFLQAYLCRQHNHSLSFSKNLLAHWLVRHEFDPI